jgi:hypothetical protein
VIGEPYAPASSPLLEGAPDPNLASDNLELHLKSQSLISLKFLGFSGNILHFWNLTAHGSVYKQGILLRT